MRILFLAKYDYSGASSRYRIHQYLPEYERMGIVCKCLPMYANAYIRNFEKGNRVMTFFYRVLAVVRRLGQLYCVPFYDLIYIEKEVIPYFPPIIEFIFHVCGVRYVLDYDDAVWHNYDKSNHIIIRKLLSGKIPILAKWAKAIITGSPYLTEVLAKYNCNVTEIPTSIQYAKYDRPMALSKNRFIIGWIGGSASSVHLASLFPALKAYFARHPQDEIHMIGFDKKLFQQYDLPRNFVYIQWTDETEVEELGKLTVGIMPMTATKIANGKCGFKLVQYMACGKPTVSTPFEANVKIDGGNGNLFATTVDEWIDALEAIRENRTYYQKIGLCNKQSILKHYSIESNSILYKAIFDNVLYNIKTPK